MRPNQGRVWRKAGRNGREGSQALTPAIKRAAFNAALMAVMERRTEDGRTIGQLVGELAVITGGVS